ncbi:family 43 glycosylhydrolase [Isoptericola sp. QY 916]|uniref:family 43 glycosylhydrolase n=1 Tax=Isoptericola sp. QY 916 TaxID=2782570 RepID=UPI003D2FEC2A|nr:family 43 glycosylhydrolase [Isoptericola sp. QY 916]
MILNGVPWFDDRGEVVNAHGACLVDHEGRYYLFGEHKTDDVNRFDGVGCWSSADLEHWTFERVVLPVQPDGPLGPDRVGERPKVMRCPATRRFVMYVHADDLGYTDPLVAVATCDTVAGEYRWHGPLVHQGEPVRRWDIGAFQDDDGTGYLLVHEGDVYRLGDDYLTAEEKVAENLAPGGESPAMWRSDDGYHLLMSRKTSWERNDNEVLTAPSVHGPWRHAGLLAPEGTLTHNSQCSFVARVRRGDDVVPMYLGDRWSFPHQASAATQVWLPLLTDGGPARLGEYWPAWDPATGEPVPLDRDAAGAVAAVDAPFRSAGPGDRLEVDLEGARFAVVGTSDDESGYARVELLDDGRVETSHLVDFYSKVPDTGPRYVSPVLPAGRWTLRVTPTGEVPTWSQKDGTRFGSTGSRVTVHRVLVLA